MIENGRINIETARNTPIPLDLPSVNDWKKIPIRENGDPLVATGIFSDYWLYTDSLYKGERQSSPYLTPIYGSLITMFLRQDLAERLIQAQMMLPFDYRLRIVDAYRDLSVQQSLFDEFEKELAETRPYMTPKERREYAQTYVSIPSTNPRRPSPHNTGGAVDLDIIKIPDYCAATFAVYHKSVARQNKAKGNWIEAYREEHTWHSMLSREGKSLNFGTPVDNAGHGSRLNYYEEAEYSHKEAVEARGNRRLLYHLMKAVGLEAYPDEWWHWNSPKSQMGAKTAGLSQAEYGGVSLTPELQAHELMRFNDYLGRLRIYKGASGHPKVNPLQTYLDVVRDLVSRIGDPQLSNNIVAEKISPR